MKRIIVLAFLLMIPSYGQASSYEILMPLPDKIDADPDKVKLGKRLFHDPMLSHNNKISCATCHDLKGGGVVPGTKHSPPGVSGKSVPLNVPTVYNSGLNFTQFWDGRAKTLEEQVDGATHGADEMGSTWKEIISKLNKNQSYVETFKTIYNTPPTPDAVRDAIATFERTLITPSRFDRFLRGDAEAISDLAKKGYKLFTSYGCASCHQGQNIGGNMFQSFGVMGDYFADRGNIKNHDLGRYHVTKDPDDKFIFKVPSLRNIELTHPYFHDGSAKTLEEAVDIIARYQLGRRLKKEENKAIVAFLKSLTGIELEEKP